jgi:hypothetical protein
LIRVSNCHSGPKSEKAERFQQTTILDSDYPKARIVPGIADAPGPGLNFYAQHGNHLFDYVHFVPVRHHILPSLAVGTLIETASLLIEATFLDPEYLSKHSGLIHVFRGLKKHLIL